MNKYGVRILTGPSVIKDVDAKQGIVVSYPSTFGVVDSGKERVNKGAFTRTINAWGPDGKKRTKVLFNHEPWSIIGRPQVLREDDYGLYAESKIVPTTLGKDVLMLIEEGVITEQSIGFTPVKTEKSEEDGILDIKEVKLYEYSFLAWGMNQETPILGVKTEGAMERIIADMNRVERVLTKGAFTTEEVPEMLTRVLKQWREDLVSVNEETNLSSIVLRVFSVDPTSETNVRDAIKELQSLLPGEPLVSTPPEKDPIESETDPTQSHSEALQALLTRVNALAEKEQAEATAARMLREFQTKLGC